MPGVLWSRADGPYCVSITLDSLWRLSHRARLLWGPFACAVSARELSLELLGPCSTPSAGRLSLAGERSGCGQRGLRLNWRNVAVGRLIWLALVSSCGDARWQGARGCSLIVWRGAQCLMSPIVRRRLGPGEHSRARDGTLAFDLLATLSSCMACIFDGLRLVS